MLQVRILWRLTSIKCSLRMLQHLGGIHSGCAISGIIWLTYKVVMTCENHFNEHNAIIALGLSTNVAVIVTAVAAFPWVRNTHHKYARSLLYFASTRLTSTSQRLRTPPSFRRLDCAIHDLYATPFAQPCGLG